MRRTGVCESPGEDPGEEDTLPYVMMTGFCSPSTCTSSSSILSIVPRAWSTRCNYSLKVEQDNMYPVGTYACTVYPPRLLSVWSLQRIFGSVSTYLPSEVIINDNLVADCGYVTGRKTGLHVPEYGLSMLLPAFLPTSTRKESVYDNTNHTFIEESPDLKERAFTLRQDAWSLGTKMHPDLKMQMDKLMMQLAKLQVEICQDYVRKYSELRARDHEESLSQIPDLITPNLHERGWLG